MQFLPQEVNVPVLISRYGTGTGNLVQIYFCNFTCFRIRIQSLFRIQI
jgi:hypothetical protein